MGSPHCTTSLRVPLNPDTGTGTLTLQSAPAKPVAQEHTPVACAQVPRLLHAFGQLPSWGGSAAPFGQTTVSVSATPELVRQLPMVVKPTPAWLFTMAQSCDARSPWASNSISPVTLVKVTASSAYSSAGPLYGSTPRSTSACSPCAIVIAASYDAGPKPFIVVLSPS